MGGFALCAGEHVGFEEWDAIQAPGGVDQFLDELGFGRSRRLVFGEELAAMRFAGGWIFGGQDRGSGGQAVAQGVERQALLSGFGAGPVECWALARLTPARSKAGAGNADIWSPQLGHNMGAGMRSGGPAEVIESGADRDG